jgi:hypothetical protein
VSTVVEAERVRRQHERARQTLADALALYREVRREAERLGVPVDEWQQLGRPRDSARPRLVLIQGGAS